MLDIYIQLKNLRHNIIFFDYLLYTAAETPQNIVLYEKSTTPTRASGHSAQRFALCVL